MSKSSKAADTANRAGDFVTTARDNPYVQRLVEDEDLRDNIVDAFHSAKSAYQRATGNGKSPVKAVASDKKVQKEMRKAAEKLQEANDRLQKPQHKSRLGRLILLALVGGVIALVVSEGARKAVLDTLFGAEEEFEYTSTTSINGS